MLQQSANRKLSPCYHRMGETYAERWSIVSRDAIVGARHGRSRDGACIDASRETLDWSAIIGGPPRSRARLGASRRSVATPLSWLESWGIDDLATYGQAMGQSTSPVRSPSTISRFWLRVRQEWEVSRTIVSLSVLDDRTLKDIGLDRSQIESIARQLDVNRRPIGTSSSFPTTLDMPEGDSFGV